MKLPIPDKIAQAHSEKLKAAILAEIREKGPMSFERYMQLALYAPGLGYYSAGARKFGEAGDFITAPELSPLFSQCVAHQCIPFLSAMEEGVILELGAGTGVMARDILLTLEKQAALPKRYLILEVSADCRDRQKNTLAQLPKALFERVEWLDRWPSSIHGVVLANEVLDAMPVRRFLWEDDALWECRVTEKKGEFDWVFEAPSEPLKKAFSELNITLPSPYLSEINCLLPGWFSGLSDALAKGVAIFIDYGFQREAFYHPDRSQGTLMCHYRHRSHGDPLMFPGIQDITAHVDFTAVAQAAKHFSVLSYSNQAQFLVESGLDQLIPPDLDAIEQYRLAQQIKTLTLPSEMGELFKVMILEKNE